MMRKRINMLREFSVPLIAGVVIAFLWANLSPETYEKFNHAPFLGPLNLHFLTNDLFMAFFFGIAAVEITQSCLPGGDLSPPSKAVNPLLATVGGIVGPVAVYFILNSIFGSNSLRNGWGIPTATDIALAWLAARLVYGRNHPVIAFLLLLAIADDAVGLLIIAIFYPDPVSPVQPLWLLLVGVGMAAAFLLRKFGCRNYWPYLLLGGSASWAGLHEAHLHPALALTCIVPFMPHPFSETKHMFEEDSSDVSTLASFEHEWKIIVDFGLFMFGLTNAGVQLTTIGTGTWLVLLALVVGKTAGIFSMGLLGQKLGFPLPNRMRYKELAVAGLLAGIGFTVALFVAGEAFTDPVIKGAAKMGAMFSIGAFPLGVLLAKIFKIKKIH